MAINQKISRYRVNSLPTSNLIAGSNYELFLGGGVYRNYVVNDSLQLTAQDGKEFIEYDTVAQLRALDSRQIWAIQNGYYKGVKLNGYYAKGDTPAPIEYYLSDTAEDDDGGSVFEVGGVKLKHDFVGEVDIRYFGANNSVSIHNIIQTIIDTGISQILIDDEYTVTSQIIFSSGISLRCTKKGKILYRPQVVNEPMIVVENCADVMFVDVNIDMSISGWFILVLNSTNITIYNSVIEGNSVFNNSTKTWTQGAQLGIQIQNSSKITVENCTLNGFRATHGIQIENSSYINIQKNNITHTNRAGVSLGVGNSFINIIENTLSENQVYFQSDGAIDIYGFAPACHDIRIERNNISRTGLGGGGSQGILNNAIRLSDAYNVTVVGNIISIDFPMFAPFNIQDRDADSPVTIKNIVFDSNRVLYNSTTTYLFRLYTTEGRSENIQFLRNIYDSTYVCGRLEIRSTTKDFRVEGNSMNLTENSNWIFFHNAFNSPSDRNGIVIANNDVTIKDGSFTVFNGCRKIFCRDNVLTKLTDSGNAGAVNNSEYGVFINNMIEGGSDFFIASSSNEITADNVVITS